MVYYKLLVVFYCQTIVKFIRNSELWRCSHRLRRENSMYCASRSFPFPKNTISKQDQRHCLSPSNSPHTMSAPETNPPLASFQDFLDHGFTEVSTTHDLCDICLNDFTNNDPAVQILKISGCRHIFGRECILVWLAAHNSCPLCRAVLIQPSASAPSHINRQARVHGGWLVNAFSETFNPRSTSTGDLVGMQWVDVRDILETGIDWNQERAYRRQVRDQHRRRMALEAERPYGGRNEPVEQQRIDLGRRVQEAVTREEREQHPAESQSIEAMDGSASEGIGEVYDAPVRRRRGIRWRWRRCVSPALFGIRF